MQLLSLTQSDQASVSAVQVQAVTFTDVPVNHWANNYIKTLAEQDIIMGFSDGSFRPDEPMTRSQFAAILQQAFAVKIKSSAQPFDDVPSSHWAAEAIDLARATSFLSGYPDNKFKPEENISRAQMLVSLVSGLGYNNNSDRYAYYTDTDNIPAYAQASITAATHRRLVVNHPFLTQLNPNRSATRAEVVASIYQALVQEGRANPLPASPYLVIAAASHWPNEPVKTLPVRTKLIGLSSDGHRLAAFVKEDLVSQDTPVSQSRFEVWNLQTSETITSRTVDVSTRVESMSFSEDGLKIAAITQTQTSQELNLLMWDLAFEQPPTSKLLGTASQLGSDDSGFAHLFSAQVAFGANDTLILSQVQAEAFESINPTERVVRIHRVGTNGTLDEMLDIPIPTLSFLPRFSFSPDGTLLAGISGVISAWRLDTGELLTTIEPKEKRFRFSSMAFTPTGALRTLAQGIPYEESLITWDLLAKSPITPSVDLPEVDRQDYTQLLSPDGIHHFMYGDVAGTRLLNVYTSKATRLNTVRGSAVFNRTGSHLAIATPEGINIFSQINSPQ